MKERLVIIPTYNEKENIENILKAVFELPMEFHVLVVDDGSPDGTGAIVKRIISEDPDKLFIEEREGKNGLGTAYIHGFKWALAKGYEYIFEMDADFSHNPKDLIRLYEACVAGADMSVGSRYVKGGDVKNWSKKRIMMSYGASIYVRMITWIHVKDSTAGFVCYTRKVLDTIDFDRIKFKGYAFQIEMKYATLKLGFKIVEVPITFIDRVLGTSKMNMKIFKEGLMGVWIMRAKSLTGTYKRSEN